MAAIEIRCTTLVVPKPPPMLTIPHLGVLQQLQDSIHGIPDPMDILYKFQQAISVAMAPIRRFLEMVEVFSALKQCIESIPKAIIQLSPTPVFDCIKQLAKIMAQILAWFPPMCYVRLYLEISAYCIDVIDEIINLFVLLDNKISSLVALFTDASLLGDLDLIQFTNCGMSEIVPTIVSVMDLLKLLQPINDVLMQVFLRLIPTSDMQKAANDYAASALYFPLASTAIAGGLPLPAFGGDSAPPDPLRPPIIPVPRLSPILVAVNQMRSAFVMLYNILAPLVGENPDKEPREIPTFQFL